MDVFEYLTVQVNLAEAARNAPDDTLNGYGGLGWEVIDIEPIDVWQRKYLMKRRVGKNYGI